MLFLHTGKQKAILTLGFIRELLPFSSQTEGTLFWGLAMTPKDGGIPSELFIEYFDSDGLPDELYQMTDRELIRLGVHRLEISPENFSDDELARLRALEAEGYSPSYIFNAGLEAMDRNHAHKISQIFSLGLAEVESRHR